MFQPMWVVFVFQGTKTPGLFRLQCSTRRSLVQFPGLAISMITRRIWDTMENYHFWFLLLFYALILSPLLGTPENAGVM